MLDLQIMDPIALGHHVGKVEDIEGSTRIIRMRVALDD
jgi:hypothetical protein